MKILFFNYEYPPLGGGAANATAYLLDEFAKMPDMEVHLVTSAIGPSIEHLRVGERVHVHRLSIGKNPSNLHTQSMRDILVYTWKAWMFAYQLVRREEKPFDATLAFFTVPCGFLAYLFKIFFRIPYLVALRGSDVPGYNQKYAVLYIFLRPLIRLIWSRAARVIPNSEGLCDLARQTASRQVFDIVPNGVDTKQFFPAYDKRPADQYIITPGASRITDRKGLVYLVEAVAELVPRYPQLHVKIMGDGSGRPALESLVKEKALESHVTFIGRVPREGTLLYYQEASLFVLPSINEGMSNAMLEALACGLPIIATETTGGTKELVENGKNGVTVPLRSASKIAEAIEGFLRSPERREMYGIESRRRAELHGWNTVAEQFKKLFEMSVQKK